MTDSAEIPVLLRALAILALGMCLVMWWMCRVVPEVWEPVIVPPVLSAPIQSGVAPDSVEELGAAREAVEIGPVPGFAPAPAASQDHSVRRVVITGRLIFEDGLPAVGELAPWVPRADQSPEALGLRPVQSARDGSFKIELETASRSVSIGVGQRVQDNIASASFEVSVPSVSSGLDALRDSVVVDVGDQIVSRGMSLILRVAFPGVRRNLVGSSWRLQLLRSDPGPVQATGPVLSIDRPAKLGADGCVRFDGLLLGRCYWIRAPREILITPGDVVVPAVSGGAHFMDIDAYDREGSQPIYVRFEGVGGDSGRRWALMRCALGEMTFSDMVPTDGQMHRIDLPSHVDVVGTSWSTVYPSGERAVAVVEMHRSGVWSLLLRQ